MSRFTDILLVSPLPDGKNWVIRRDFGYDVGVEGSGETIDVHPNFTTDFTSVPRPMWWLLPKWGKYGNAAVVHDYCYWDQSYSRKRSDEIFKEAMKVLGVPGWQVTTIYYAVRWFGFFAWNANKKMKAKDPNSKYYPMNDEEKPESAKE